MRLPNDMLICATDLLMLFLILFLLAFMAVQYDSSKGLGEYDYTRLNTLISDEGDINGNFSSIDFIAVVIENKKINIYRNSSFGIIYLDTYKTVKTFIESENFDIKFNYVIYEKDKSDLLAELIRAFALKNIPIGLAQVAI